MLSESEVIKLLFGFKLKYLRQEQGLGLEELAARTGLSKSYIHDIEKGKKYPKVDKINTLATGLGVEYDFLVSRRASKKMQPVVDLLTSDLLKEFPLEQFGIQTPKLLELMATTPDRANAFISTITGITRHYQLEREHLYFTALRSFQDLHDNYFPELEEIAAAIRRELHLPTGKEMDVAMMTKALQEHFQIRVDYEGLAKVTAWGECRSYYSKAMRVLYIREDLSPAQQRFLLGRELAFQHQQWTQRPYETRILEVPDFETLLNNFQASYVASALLMDETAMVEDIRTWMEARSWRPHQLKQFLVDYEVTPEMLLQRLTNLLPHHFGLGDLFFIRLQGDRDLKHYRMTKELHLSQQHSPYANALNEHYCRRWVSVNIIKQARQRLSDSEEPAILIDAQISRYWATTNEYLCISMARSEAGSNQNLSSVTLGLMINDHSRELIGFLGDTSVPTRIVNTTCERCSVPDCEARVVPPLALEQGKRVKRIKEQLEQLDGGARDL